MDVEYEKDVSLLEEIKSIVTTPSSSRIHSALETTPILRAWRSGSLCWLQTSEGFVWFRQLEGETLRASIERITGHRARFYLVLRFIEEVDETAVSNLGAISISEANRVTLFTGCAQLLPKIIVARMIVLRPGEVTLPVPGVEQPVPLEELDGKQHPSGYKATFLEEHPQGYMFLVSHPETGDAFKFLLKPPG